MLDFLNNIKYDPFVIIFIGLVLVQLFYNLYFFIRLAFYFEADAESELQLQNISIIICAKDEVKICRNIYPWL